MAWSIAWGIVGAYFILVAGIAALAIYGAIFTAIEKSCGSLAVILLQFIGVVAVLCVWFK